jgi:hypothetical protein
MPALLTTADEQAARLSAPLEEALKLQRPLPDDALHDAQVRHGSKVGVLALRLL